MPIVPVIMLFLVGSYFSYRKGYDIGYDDAMDHAIKEMNRLKEFVNNLKQKNNDA